MTASRTLRLQLEYDGTDFAGWQVQRDLRTVQGVVEQAARTILAEPEASVQSAGRTDSGVHASGQVAHVVTRSKLDVQRIGTAFNAVMPRDVRVRRVEEAAEDFHARFSAVAREYRYHIWHRGPVPPFLSRYCHGVRHPLDIEAMRGAASLFIGTHDLSSFRAASCVARSPVRTVTLSRLDEHGNMLVYTIRSGGFLQHMVRIVVGTLLAVGSGRLRVDDVGEILRAADRRRAAATSTPTGLFLHRVFYDVAESAVEPVIGAVLNFGPVQDPWPVLNSWKSNT